jgi:hypothetical protein
MRRRLSTMEHLIIDIDVLIHVIKTPPDDYENCIENHEDEIDNGANKA